MAKDYYAVLGIPRDCPQDEIKQTYRKLARKYHPDVSTEADAEERFKEINEAYEVLSDPEKRSVYDRYGTVTPNGMGGGAGGYDFGGFRDPFDIFTEVFGNFGGFGGGRDRSGPHRGNDLRVNVDLTFEEAAFGVDREIEVQRTEPCATCSGTGAEPGTKPERCTECNGAGQVRRVQHTFLGSFVNVAPCPTCQGTGQVIRTPCHTCNGTGKNFARRRMKVTIPAGVDDGMSVRLAGEGEQGERGGPPGNLYVTVHVQPHAYFKRRGVDVLLEMQINVAQAALGSSVKVPTLDGERQITVPPGTQAGTIFRLRGLGIPNVRGSGRGDQLIVVQVGIPAHLTAEQRQLFQELARTLGTESVMGGKQSFVDRIKESLGL